MRILFFIILGLLIIAVLSESKNTNKNNKNEITNVNEFDRRGATSSCMYFIKQLLHDPNSADFETSDNANVQIKANHAIVVRSVRANNAFGANRLESFICFMEIRDGTIQPILITPKDKNTAEILVLLKSWGILEKSEDNPTHRSHMR